MGSYKYITPNLGGVKSKGVAVVLSFVLLSAIVIVAVVAVYTWGIPLIEQSKKLAEAQKGTVFLSNVNEIIKELITEGQGSRRTITFSFAYGEILTGNSSLQYKINGVCIAGNEYVQSSCNGEMILELKKERFRVTGNVMASGGKISLRNAGYDNETIIDVTVG